MLGSYIAEHKHIYLSTFKLLTWLTNVLYLIYNKEKNMWITQEKNIILAYKIPATRYQRPSNQTINLSKNDLRSWIQWLESKNATYTVTYK